MSQSPVGTNLLQSLEVLPELVFQLVGQDLGVLPVLGVFLSVEEPVGDLVLPGVLHDCDNPINLCVCVCVCVWKGS